MTHIEDIETARTFLNAISGFTEIVSFKLFGSRARGDGAKDSDMDIFIVVPKLTRELDRKISDVAWDIGMDKDVVITTVVCASTDLNKPGFRGSPFMNAIEREGVAV